MYAQAIDKIEENRKDTILNLNNVEISPCVYSEHAITICDHDFFNEFSIQVFRSQSFVVDDTVTNMIRLLQSGLNSNCPKICFVSFLSLIDKDAVKLNSEMCRIKSTITPSFYSEYCSKKSVQFIVLYYVEFMIIRKFHVPSGSVVKRIALKKKGSRENVEAVDYNLIIQHYIKWFESGGYNKNRDINLRKTGYKWSVKLHKIKQ